MAYVLGLVAGISFGVILAALIVIKMTNLRDLKGNKELVYIRDTVDDVTARLIELNEKNYFDGEDTFINQILDELFLLKKHLNRYNY